VEEIERVITDLLFIDRGRIVLGCSMDQYESRYTEVTVPPQHRAAACALNPICERETLGRSVFLYDGVERERLAALGDARTPGIADLFVAVMNRQPGRFQETVP
jgi:ABC-2 type transport system ATP-binding protein